MKLKPVIIVVPVYRLPLTADEQISLRHLRYHLGKHEVAIMAPQSLVIDSAELRDLTVVRFGNENFASVAGYSRLMLTKEFYRRFAGYEYMLIYQLDCLVFSSDLLYWCRQGLDYVGAPWFADHKNDSTGGFVAAGNGGFCLRRVRACLKVLESRKLWLPPGELARRTAWFPNSPVARRVFVWLKTPFYAFGYKNRVVDYLRYYDQNEDIFWTGEAREYYPGFTVASPGQALPFSFEVAPRFCFERNNRQLPFGCHAWGKYDRAFWEPYLLKD